MDRIPADGGCGWKNEDSKRRMEKNVDKLKKIRIKRENADSKKRKKQTNTKRKKRKRKRREKDAPFLLLRTAVKIYMYSPLLEAD